MNKRIVVVVAGMLFALMIAAAADASPMFVATAKNFRGALYLGFGPSPYHASEMAVAKCSQDSFVPPSCKVVSVRMECPPPAPMAYKPIRKSRPKVSQNPSPGYQWGRPMP